MKIKTLSMLAGTAVPLILTGSASAGFLGVRATSKPNVFGLLVVNVYAEFDRPDPGDGSGDHMVHIAGSPNAPLNIQVIGGTFYNSGFGSDQAPTVCLRLRDLPVALLRHVRDDRQEDRHWGHLDHYAGFPDRYHG